MSRRRIAEKCDQPGETDVSLLCGGDTDLRALRGIRTRGLPYRRPFVEWLHRRPAWKQGKIPTIDYERANVWTVWTNPAVLVSSPTAPPRVRGRKERPHPINPVSTSLRVTDHEIEFMHAEVTNSSLFGIAYPRYAPVRQISHRSAS